MTKTQSGIADTPKKYLVLDMHNLFHRSYFAVSNDRSHVNEDHVGLTFHSALFTLRRLHTLFRPSKTVAVFDEGESWRSLYTKTDDCISQKIYKDHRRKGMTKSQKEAYMAFRRSVHEFRSLLDERTKIICLSRNLLEADDLIASFVHSFPLDTKLVVSSDSDMLQLLAEPNTQIIDPVTAKKRTLEEYDRSPRYFLFEKCIRGDVSDNVQSAFPGVRKTRIKEAFKDQFVLANLMGEKWTSHDGREFVVRDLYEENQMLIDLSMSPESVREMAKETVMEAVNRERKYSDFHMLKFLGQKGLKNIAEDLGQFTKIFAQ